MAYHGIHKWHGMVLYVYSTHRNISGAECSTKRDMTATVVPIHNASRAKQDSELYGTTARIMDGSAHVL